MLDDITSTGYVALEEYSVLSKTVFLAAMIVLTATGGFAADLPAKTYTKAPVAPKPFSWTGCFAGVNAGGAFSDDKIRSSGDFAPPVSPAAGRSVATISSLRPGSWALRVERPGPV